MKVLKTIIIEDEPLALQSLAAILKKYCPEVKVVQTAQSIEEGVAAIQECQPDLVFLDVQLKKGTGFDVLIQLEHLQFEVIFVTAFSQYAIKAIKFNALDYLLKPIDLDELRAAVRKTGEKRSFNARNRPLEAFVANRDDYRKDPVITLPTSHTFELIKVNSIIRCEAEGSYTRFFVENTKSILVSKHIKTYEELLSPELFFRPHQSHLINRNFLKRYIKTDGGFLLFTDGSKVPVSKHKRDAFLKWIRA